MIGERGPGWGVDYGEVGKIAQNARSAHGDAEVRGVRVPYGALACPFSFHPQQVMVSSDAMAQL